MIAPIIENDLFDFIQGLLEEEEGTESQGENDLFDFIKNLIEE